MMEQPTEAPSRRFYRVFSTVHLVLEVGCVEALCIYAAYAALAAGRPARMWLAMGWFILFATVYPHIHRWAFHHERRAGR